MYPCAVVGRTNGTHAGLACTPHTSFVAQQLDVLDNSKRLKRLQQGFLLRDGVMPRMPS